MRRPLLVSIALCVAPLACGSTIGSLTPARSPAVAQWFDRAKASYRGADFEDARDGRRALVDNSLPGAPFANADFP